MSFQLEAHVCCSLPPFWTDLPTERVAGLQITQFQLFAIATMQQVSLSQAQNTLSPQSLTEASLSANIQILQRLTAKDQPLPSLE